MRREAEEHAEEDRKLKEKVEAKNRADALIYSTEKALKENGDAVDADTRKGIEDALENLKKVVESGDVEAITAAEQDLATKSQKLGEAVYKKMQEEQAAGAGGAGAAASGADQGASGGAGGAAEAEVVDAEVVDDAKK